MSASTFFAAADDIVFRTFGVAAIYKAAGTGPNTAVTVVREQPTADGSAFGFAVRAGAQMLHVRASEIATVAKGDTFTIGVDVLTVQGAPALDGQRTKWMVEC
jgi:hypothetical protein